MQNDFQLTVGAMRRRLRSCYPEPGGGDARGRRARARLLRARWPSASTASRGCSSASASSAATAWRRSPGTSQRHFELYLAVPSYGAVLHTLNIRLFPEQIVYIVNHAEDGVIFVDGSLVEPLAKLAPQFEGVRHFVVMGDGDLDALPGALSLRAAARGGRRGRASTSPRSTSAQAAALCYTSGTTGNPKGVLYSHRSIVAALDDDLHGRRRRALVARPRAGRSCRCSTSTPGACPSPRRSPAPSCCCPAASCRASRWRELDRGRARHAAGRRADDARRPAAPTPTSTAATSARCAARICGGSAVPRSSSWRTSGAPRRAHPPGVGDDRDEPDRHRGPAPGGRRRGRGALGLPHAPAAVP